MKRVVLVLFLGFLVLVVRCGKGPTEPEDDYTLEASETIGSEGGTLEIEGFSLAVPSGAFDSTVNLELYASSDDRPFGDNCASRTFRLEGLPDEYSQPLQLSIKYQGALSDSSFVAVGEEAMVAASGELETAYQMLSATDSVGYLHCELPAGEGDTTFLRRSYHHAISGSDKGRKILVASKYAAKWFAYTWIDTHYNIYVPSGLAVSITDLADLFDKAFYTFFALMHYGIFGLPDVIVRDLGTDDYCKFKYRNRDRYAYVEVNAKKMTQTDFPKLQVMIGREVYRYILFSRMYDPYCPVMVGPAQQDYYWLNEAAVSWCEEKFVSEEEEKNYVPICFPGNEMAPFNGMQAGEGDIITKARNHGCGMSAMIKYLVDWLDDPNPVPHESQSVLSKIHGRLGMLSKYHPVEAVINGIGLPGGLPSNWWWDFLKKYVQGDIYNVSSDVFTKEKNISGLFEIKSDSDTLAKFPGSYPDLSAKLYRTNLKHKTIHENTKITLKVSTSVAAEDMKLVLFKFVGSQSREALFAIHFLQNISKRPWNL